MGLISNLLKKREETNEESTPVVDNNERGAANPEESQPAQEVETPKNSVLTPVTYDPSTEKPVDLIHDPDSNVKDPATPSFL